jgi:hypothetical protein
MYHPSTAVHGLSAIESSAVQKLGDEYEQRLLQCGYNQKVVRVHLHAVVPFSVWLELRDHELKEIDEDTLVSFERHRSSRTC